MMEEMQRSEVRDRPLYRRLAKQGKKIDEFSL